MCPRSTRQRERAIYLAQAEDVAEKFREKTVEGKLAKHLKEIALLDQEFVRDQGEKKPRTIEELRAEVAAWSGRTSRSGDSCVELGG